MTGPKKICTVDSFPEESAISWLETARTTCVKARHAATLTLSSPAVANISLRTEVYIVLGGVGVEDKCFLT